MNSGFCWPAAYYSFLQESGLTAADTVADFHGIPFFSSDTEMYHLNQFGCKCNGKVKIEKLFLEINGTKGSAMKKVACNKSAVRNTKSEVRSPLKSFPFTILLQPITFLLVLMTALHFFIVCELRTDVWNTQV